MAIAFSRMRPLATKHVELSESQVATSSNSLRGNRSNNLNPEKAPSIGTSIGSRIFGTSSSLRGNRSNIQSPETAPEKYPSTPVHRKKKLSSLNAPIQDLEHTKKQPSTSNTKANNVENSPKGNYRSRIPLPGSKSRPVASNGNPEHLVANHMAAQKRMSVDSGRAGTPATASSEVSTSENSNHVVSIHRYETQNQNIVDRRTSKRLLEQRLHEQMKRREPESKNQTIQVNSVHSFDKEEQISSVKPKATLLSQSLPAMPSNSNTSNGLKAMNFHDKLPEQLQERKIQIEARTNEKLTISNYDDIDESEGKSPRAPPPVCSIQFSTDEISPIHSPIESPISKMKQLRDADIRSKLKGLITPLISGDEEEDAPLIEIQSAVQKEPKTVLVRNTRKIRKDQKRLLVETDSEIKRMEVRLAELKLIREIQVLEEELKRQGIAPVLSKPPRAPTAIRASPANTSARTVRTAVPPAASSEPPATSLAGPATSSEHTVRATNKSRNRAQNVAERSTSTHQSMATTNTMKCYSSPNRIPSRPLLVGAKQKPSSSWASSVAAKPSPRTPSSPTWASKSYLKPASSTTAKPSPRTLSSPPTWASKSYLKPPLKTG